MNKFKELDKRTVYEIESEILKKWQEMDILNESIKNIYSQNMANIYQLLLPIADHPVNDKIISFKSYLLSIMIFIIKNNIIAIAKFINVGINLFLKKFSL